jgi:hypothetical protein
LKKPSQQRATTRFANQQDVAELAAVEREAWGDGAATEQQLSARILNVPKGNIVAVAPDGRLCGLTSFCFIDYDDYERRCACSWNDLSGFGTASTNVHGAPDLFGINLGVARWAPRDTSIQLLGEVVREGVRLGARRGILGARMPGFHKHADKMTAEEYFVAERRPGVPLDPELHYYYKFGMRPVKLVEDYFEDPDSLNWGVLVQMLVPLPLRVAGRFVAALPLDIVALMDRFG